MTNPYTAFPLDAFMAAETSVALALTAVVLFRPTRSLVSRFLLLAAIYLAVIAPVLPDLIRGLGYEWSLDRYLMTLEVSAALATLAMAFSRPRWLFFIGLAGEIALYRATHFFTDENLALSALHVGWFGALIGFEKLIDAPPEQPAPYPVERRYWLGDLTLAAIATFLAAVVATVVLKRRCDSADEWAYTFQAAVYAKLHAYSERPPCYEALRSFWVFEKDGHVFSQYLPGWPLFMAPFFATGVLWLAGPASLGVLVVGVARLARRGAAATIDVRTATAPDQHVRLAGVVAALALILSDMMLVNGGSRFPHVWVCATFAWSIEALCMISSPLAARRQITWGVVLGCSLAWLLATRHVDGCFLGAGMFIYAVHAFSQGRISARAITAVAVPFVFFGAFTLILLRLQLGAWFTTGYSLTAVIHPWNKMIFSVPRPNEWRWGIPIDAGAYVWFPMAPAVGFAGLLALGRTRERRLSFMMGLGAIITLGFYTSIELSRGWDFGYGPRYQMVVCVPMAVSAGVLFAPIFNAALARVASGRRALGLGGGAAITAAAALIGSIRLIPMLFPGIVEDIKARNIVFDTIAKQNLSNAVVWVAKGATISDPLDITQNLPIDMYDESVWVLRDTLPAMHQCIRTTFPNRRVYRMQGGHIVPAE